MSAEDVWKARFDRERAARREAEALLHEKSRELYDLKQQAEQRADDLARSLAQLEATQSELVQREKMAALGGLVAGVAHEINTPMGAAVTAVSHTEDQLRHLSRQVESGTLTRGSMRAVVAEAQESLALASRNLQRGAALVNSFKNIAVDQSNATSRSVAIKELVDDVVLSLGPLSRRSAVEVSTEVPADLILHVDAGALVQVMTNLLQNACLHAFDGWPHRRNVRIGVQSSAAMIGIDIEDNGCGMDAETAARVFEPFFTTRRGQGGTGLGLHICHNLITSRFKGTITLTTAPQSGSHWRLRLPIPSPALSRSEPK